MDKTFRFRRTSLIAKKTLLALTIQGLCANVVAQIPHRKTYIGKDFVDGFYFYTEPDPAGGAVVYVDRNKAEQGGLVSWTDTNFIMKPDTVNEATLALGRDSVRLVSNDKFADGVYIFDIDHIPVGCGTWPAAWMTAEDGWPYTGEIDVVEGANALPSNSSTSQVQRPQILAEVPSTPPSSEPEHQNVVSLHTGPSCPLKPITASEMTGTLLNQDCSGLSDGNIGCGIEIPGPSFGAEFNANGGGVYALWRDLKNSSSIHAWFWDRSIDPPADITNITSDAVDPTKWGTPSASFHLESDACKTAFSAHVIVLNIDFCGGYGEATFASSGCPGSCQTYVRYNPTEFNDAFFDFRSVRVYSADSSASRTAWSFGTVFIAAIFLLWGFL